MKIEVNHYLMYPTAGYIEMDNDKNITVFVTGTVYFLAERLKEQGEQPHAIIKAINQHIEDQINEYTVA